MTARKPLDRYRRIVIKIGSALLVDRTAGLKKAWLDGMCADIAGLKAKGIEQNTLVIFFSDNGACAEIVEPGWYDIPSRTRDGRPIRAGNADHSVFAGLDDIWQSYGVGWANVSDTPFLLYKHFTHEGGIASPFIASWPRVIRANGGLNREIGHVTDIMATCLELAGARHADSVQGQKTVPLEGTSLLPVFQGKAVTRPAALCWEHEGNRAVRQGKWKLVSRHGKDWETGPN